MRSPCVANCGLGEDDICMGCFRHIDEIVGWSQSTETEQQQIIDACAVRKQQYVDKVNTQILNRETYKKAEASIASAKLTAK